MGQTCKILFLFFNVHVVLLASLFSVTTGLKCYTCDYEEDMVHHHNCKDQPDKACLYEVEDDDEGTGLKNDPRPPLTSWYQERTRKFDHNNYWGSMKDSEEKVADDCNNNKKKSKLGLFSSKKWQSVRKNVEKMCVKATGKIDGKPYVSRFGVRVSIPSDDFRKDGCRSIPDDDGLSDGILCFCHTDACNHSSSSFKFSVLAKVTPLFLTLFFTHYMVTSF